MHPGPPAHMVPGLHKPSTPLRSWKKSGHISVGAARAHRKYLVVILRPSSTGVFCPTACLTIQLPCVTRGMILNALWRRTVVAASPPASSRNLAPAPGGFSAPPAEVLGPAVLGVLWSR